MGFENRKSSRVKTQLNLCYWVASDERNLTYRGQTVNLSESGMAFESQNLLQDGEVLLTEFSLPAFQRPLRVSCQVVRCEACEGRPFYQARVKFLDLGSEDLRAVKKYVFELLYPVLASKAGLGKLFFANLEPVDAWYREVSQAEYKNLLEGRHYLQLKEIAYLKNFQQALEKMFGSKQPWSLTVFGNKALQERHFCWFEFKSSLAKLQCLAKVLWCHQEGQRDYEAGLNLSAFNKEEAFRIEKSNPG